MGRSEAEPTVRWYVSIIKERFQERSSIEVEFMSHIFIDWVNAVHLHDLAHRAAEFPHTEEHQLTAELHALEERVQGLEQRVAQIEAQDGRHLTLVRERFAAACKSIPEVEGAYIRETAEGIELLFDLDARDLEVTRRLLEIEWTLFEEHPSLYIEISTTALNELSSPESRVADFELIYQKS